MKRKDCPKEIWIGENVWTVRFVKNCGATDGFENIGLCDPSEHTLYIKTGLTPRERFEVLIHEVMHAVEYEYSFEIPHELINKLERPLARLISDNWMVA